MKLEPENIWFSYMNHIPAIVVKEIEKQGREDLEIYYKKVKTCKLCKKDYGIDKEERTSDEKDICVVCNYRKMRFK